MEIPRIAVAAPLDWAAPENNFEGYYRQVVEIAAGNPELRLYIVDVFRIAPDGLLPALDLANGKISRLPVSTFELMHFLELEHYRDLDRPFYEKWAEVSQVMDRLEALGTLCVNSIDSVRYYMSKHYLFELKAAGIPIMDTRLVDARTLLTDLKASLPPGRFVVKPLRGECAKHVYELGSMETTAYERLQTQDEQYLLQPLHEEVLSGEIGLFYIGCRLAHAIMRKPESGADLSHFPVKTTTVAHRPTSTELAFGEQVRKALPVPLDFYRIDFIHTQNGPLLMEIEAVDPFHYPQFNPDYAGRIGSLYHEKIPIPALY